MPDAVWHPVSETPPNEWMRDESLLFCVALTNVDGTREVAAAMPHWGWDRKTSPWTAENIRFLGWVNLRDYYADETGSFSDDYVDERVTHWARVPLPAPPEDA